MKFAEIMNLDTHALKEKLKELSLKLGELNLKKSIAAQSIKDTSVFRKMRRNIAQIKFKLSQGN